MILNTWLLIEGNGLLIDYQNNPQWQPIHYTVYVHSQCFWVPYAIWTHTTVLHYRKLSMHCAFGYDQKKPAWYLDKKDEVFKGGVEVCLLLQLHDWVKVLVVNVSIYTKETLQNGLGHRHEVLGKGDTWRMQETMKSTMRKNRRGKTDKYRKMIVAPLSYDYLIYFTLKNDKAWVWEKLPIQYKH